MIVAALVSSHSSGQNFFRHHDAAGSNQQWSGSMDDLKPCHQVSMYSFTCIGTVTANRSPYHFAWCFLTAHQASLNLTRLSNGASSMLTTPLRTYVLIEGDQPWIRNGSGG
jgi:hypothetical protein